MELGKQYFEVTWLRDMEEATLESHQAALRLRASWKMTL